MTFCDRMVTVLIWVLEINMKKVQIVINKNDISRVRKSIEENIGNRVKITVKKGRKRVTIRYGTIKAVYPYTFNVLLENISAFADKYKLHIDFIYLPWMFFTIHYKPQVGEM